MNILEYIKAGFRIPPPSEKPAIDYSAIRIGPDAPMTDLERRAYDGIVAILELSHTTATKRGWYNDKETGAAIDRNFGEVVALMHSELSEALEADRKLLTDEKLPWRPGVEVEFADTIIRIADTAEARGDDVAGAFIEKNRFNMIRPDHDLQNRANGGKRY